MTDFSEDVQTRMRRDYLISKVFAAILLTEHQGGSLDLKSKAVRDRMETIARSSTADISFVFDAFYLVNTMASALAVRAVATEVMGARHALKLPEKSLGSKVKSHLNIFCELCIELLLEHEPGRFNLTGPDYRARIARIKEELRELEITSVQIARALHEINRLAFDRHQEKLEKELLDEEAAAALSTDSESVNLEKPTLRIASSK
jgi:hypothetical protein